MIELTEAQRQELTGPEPVVVDPVTQETYVLVRQEVYERIRSLLTEELPSMQEVARLVEANLQEDDANDPWLASYQK
jgi:hypothetical protein